MPDKMSNIAAMFSIFRKLGGEEAALEIIARRAGEKPGAEAVRMWKRQHRIPALRAVELLEECRLRGIEATWPADFVIDDLSPSISDYAPSSEEAAE